MKTTINIDDNLLFKAQQLTGIKTKKAVVNKALRLLLSFDSPQKITDLIGDKK